jgi:predicted ATPase
MGQANNNLNPMNLFLKVDHNYALPIETNVDFIKKLENIVKTTSFIAEKHPDVLTDFADILGGESTVTLNDHLYYVPKGKRVKLSMDQSSSAVRSLLDIGFYLKHEAQMGDLLMVDEPELNLHPENQRRVARLFARLVNLGIKVFITTHSDYIIKELNTLIMLKRKTQCQTLTPADIDPEMGIEARSFDTTIETMNRIQEAIVWGKD